MQRSPLRADIIFSRGAVFATFTQSAFSARLGLQISCEQSDWQLSFISQICDQFSSFLCSVEDLDIKTIGPSSGLRAFDSTKNCRVIGVLATDILRALRPADVLPALRNLHIQPVFMHEPLMDSVVSDINTPQTRTLSEHLEQPIFSDLMHLITGHSFDIHVLRALKQSFVVVLLHLEEEIGPCRATEPIQNIIRVLNLTMRDVEEAWRVWCHDHVRAALRSEHAFIPARYQGRPPTAFAECQSPGPTFQVTRGPLPTTNPGGGRPMRDQ
ncbi:hypothetical protein EDB87DRAFT_1628551 [Lactarius vividus]|nr:hypothetical protein EDB87DRAFT_1628551 [Lactarius vividus]